MSTNPFYAHAPGGNFDDDTTEYNYVTCDPSDPDSYFQIYKDAEGKSWDGKTLPTMLLFNINSNERAEPENYFGLSIFERDKMVYGMSPDHSSMWVFAPVKLAMDNHPMIDDLSPVCLEGQYLKNFLYGDEECLNCLLTGNYTVSRKALCREYATVEGADSQPRTQRMYFRDVLDTNNTNFRMIMSYSRSNETWIPNIVTSTMNCPSHFVVQHSGPTASTSCTTPLVFIGHPRIPYVVDRYRSGENEHFNQIWSKASDLVKSTVDLVVYLEMRVTAF